MRPERVAILTSAQSWFVPYAKKLAQVLKKRRILAKLFFHHKDIPESFSVVFILSYFRLIEKAFLRKRQHNLVVHESALPKGSGWAPLFWQILEGKRKIPIVLFEAKEQADRGDIYLKDYLVFKGDELYDEIRQKQARKTIELCLGFIKNYARITPKKQKGLPTHYRKRNPLDSRLSLDKTIGEQFNLLRIANNQDFPVFFCYQGNKYILKIFKEKEK
jgi:methionyl-tRNA formyltransferase